MKVYIGKDKCDMARHAADMAADKIRKAIAERGEARIIVATGASQFEFLAALVKEPGIDWTKVTGFHLDEYVGIPATHKASFRGYMRERLVAKTPQPLKVFNEVNGEAPDTEAEIGRLEKLIRVAPIDVACVGIGENGHLAFNDPPADIDTNRAYKVVPLDDKCRMQQVGEGWFATKDDVPTHAFSMTMKQILWSKSIVCTCPDARKADAVVGAVEGPVTNMLPSSFMQMHPDCGMFLDPPSAAKLAKKYA
ncbi:MAG: glucosamine-6-phosphate deaminase [Candidatus Cloacimonetes bacterium]|nr:glucosamine-6-phosphate deaminase [Candidatus Cloacimonadota bacterium]